MATAEQIKALVKSYADGDSERFRSVALQIAAASAKKGQLDLAEQLRTLVDSVKRQQVPVGQPRAVPIARPAGELSGLITASYPATSLGEMVLPASVREALREVVRQHHQRELLRNHRLTPKRRLLLVGPPGCGKTMTASALANECHLPLMTVQLHTLITRYLGETAAKLHLVFDAMVATPGVYLFDEFDAIGATRSARNDVGEIRRVLNSFLQFMERDDSESIVIAATNLPGMLDPALFRRFDDVIEYTRPTGSMVREIVQNRLSAFDISQILWKSVSVAARNLSHADISRACDAAAKTAVLADRRTITSQSLIVSLRARRSLHKAGESRKRQ
jgi:SpoVK/Ycf46/Vps4 family AAA+-type ATPase